MENFRIDFTLSNPFPDGKMLGECGEKNAVQLIITPPDDLASREEIRSYVVAFSTENGPVRYGPVPKTEIITVPVSKALTVGTALSVQLEGYDADGEFIIKSKVLTGIMLSNSIVDGAVGMTDDVTEIPGHLHDNLSVLEYFKDINGNLVYKDMVVSVGNPLKSVVIKTEKGGFSVLTDTPAQNCLIFIAGKNSDGEFYIPEGVIVRRIEVNTSSDDDPVWVDFNDLNDSESFMPYVINMHKALHSEFYNGTILGTVYFPFEVNNFYHAAANYEINSLRVTYEESGEK